MDGDIYVGHVFSKGVLGVELSNVSLEHGIGVVFRMCVV